MKNFYRNYGYNCCSADPESSKILTKFSEGKEKKFFSSNFSHIKHF
jgi:hypothetical protein